MNIFFLDSDPTKIAEYHCDKHIVKMVLETAQLLCGVHWACGGEAPYRLSHKNHPCAVWARESQANYEYLCEIGLALCAEYTYRYGKKHKSEDVIMWCTLNIPSLTRSEMTEPPKAMPDEYKDSCIITSYRNYYNNAKSHFAKWTKREMPIWFNSVS
jgi:hypothetical protein